MNPKLPLYVIFMDGERWILNSDNEITS